MFFRRFFVLSSTVILTMSASCKARHDQSEVKGNTSAFSPSFSIPLKPIKKENGVAIYDLQQPNSDIAPSIVSSRSWRLHSVKDGRTNDNITVFPGTLKTMPMVGVEIGPNILPSAPQEISQAGVKTLSASDSSFMILSNENDMLTSAVTLNLYTDASKVSDPSQIAIYFQAINYPGADGEVSGILPSASLDIIPEGRQIHVVARSIKWWGAYQLVTVPSTMPESLYVPSTATLTSRVLFQNPPSIAVTPVRVGR